MPLPAPNTPWPPPGHAKAYEEFDRWDAWYSGDLDRLYAAYSGRNDRPLFDTRAQRSDGVIGRLTRWFLGQPPTPGQRITKLHVPAAGDLANTWADMMFGQTPKVTAANPDTAQRLDDLFDEDTWLQLHEAAQVQGALGGVYLTVGFDRAADNARPLVYVNHADSAVPRFAGRRLAEVTFHTELEERDGEILRHLEWHGMDGGECIIQHGLYLGTRDNLGQLIPLTEAPELEHLIELLEPDGQTVPTGLPRLDTTYVKYRPTKTWRREAAIRRLGASMYSGIEPAMDALDEVYSSWVRDIRLAKARLIVPSSYLRDLGAGNGALFDADREIWSPVNALTQEAMSITPAQFAIRFQEHQGTAAELWERIVSGAGFSAQTFGLTGEAAMTAAESWARERRSHYTRLGGIRNWTLGIRDLAELLLLIDRAEFGGTAPIEEAQVEFPPMVAEQPQQRAETALAMRSAQAASTETLVRMLHPDWEDDQVAQEVAAIEGEQSAERDALAPDPLAELDAAVDQARQGIPADGDGEE